MKIYVQWLLFAMVMVIPGRVFAAAGGGPGQKLGEMIQGEVGWLFLAGVTVLSVVYFVKREFTRFIGFAVFALFTAIFVFDPTKIKDMGIKLFEQVFGGWM